MSVSTHTRQWPPVTVGQVIEPAVYNGEIDGIISAINAIVTEVTSFPNGITITGAMTFAGATTFNDVVEFNEEVTATAGVTVSGEAGFATNILALAAVRHYITGSTVDYSPDYAIYTIYGHGVFRLPAASATYLGRVVLVSWMDEPAVGVGSLGIVEAVGSPSRTIISLTEDGTNRQYVILACVWELATETYAWKAWSTFSNSV